MKTKTERDEIQRQLNENDDGHEGDFVVGLASTILILLAIAASVVILLALRRAGID